MVSPARARAAATTPDDLYREIKRWQKRLNKMMERPNVEQADIALTQLELDNATRLYHESLDSEDSGSG